MIPFFQGREIEGHYELWRLPTFIFILLKYCTSNLTVQTYLRRADSWIPYELGIQKTYTSLETSFMSLSFIRRYCSMKNVFAIQLHKTLIFLISLWCIGLKTYRMQGCCSVPQVLITSQEKFGLLWNTASRKIAIETMVSREMSNKLSGWASAKFMAEMIELKNVWRFFTLILMNC